MSDRTKAFVWLMLWMTLLCSIPFIVGFAVRQDRAKLGTSQQVTVPQLTRAGDCVVGKEINGWFMLVCKHDGKVTK